jgi:hypothetical protein
MDRHQLAAALVELAEKRAGERRAVDVPFPGVNRRQGVDRRQEWADHWAQS